MIITIALGVMLGIYLLLLLGQIMSSLSDFWEYCDESLERLAKKYLD